ncbi:MAG: hypothetical protein BroJett022_17310 [Actinomycetes bacterium]|nr:MAG: hypothetical protein BroJett022_17310 [Actinomycetes bacterium]
MQLQGDQRALLQLLCERGQSYEDIAGLLGGSAEEVRDRARAALREIGGADPDADVALTDFLLGQADPIGRADAIRHLQADPEALDLAQGIQAGLEVVVPGAAQPKLPEPRGRRRKAALPEASEAAAEPSPADEGPRRRRALIAGLGAAGLALVVAILLVADVFSGPDGGDAPAAVAEQRLAEVPLEPTGGSGVAGSVTFGVAVGEQVYADVDVDGLDPRPAKGTANLLWLMIGDRGGFPLQTPLVPDRNGGFSGRIAVPTAIAFTVGRQADSLRVSTTPLDAISSAAEQAIEQQVPIIPFVGDELASGKIPLISEGGGGGDATGPTG